MAYKREQQKKCRESQKLPRHFFMQIQFYSALKNAIFLAVLVQTAK